MSDGESPGRRRICVILDGRFHPCDLRCAQAAERRRYAVVRGAPLNAAPAFGYARLRSPKLAARALSRPCWARRASAANLLRRRPSHALGPVLRTLATLDPRGFASRPARAGFEPGWPRLRLACRGFAPRDRPLAGARSRPRFGWRRQRARQSHAVRLSRTLQPPASLGACPDPAPPKAFASAQGRRLNA